MKYNQIINNLNLLIDSGIREFLEDSPQKYYNAKNEKSLNRYLIFEGKMHYYITFIPGYS